MKFIYNQTQDSIEFNQNDIRSIFNLDLENEKNKVEKLVNQLNENIYLYLEKPEEFIKKYKEELDIDIKEEILNFKSNELILINNLDNTMKEKTKKIREDILSKFLMIDNLCILMGNGCSIYAGSRATNNRQNNRQDEPSYKKVLSNFNTSNKKLKEIVNKLQQLDRPEQILDKLYEILSYYSNIIEDSKLSKKIENLILEFKKVFIKDYVLDIDYSSNFLHKLFLKRLISRNQKLPRVNIFTLNYDLLIEKSAEELEIFVNNGFLGFQKRIFSPSIYYTDVHLNHSDGSKSYTKSINLYKLHGSLSWVLDEEKTPYGITEIQCKFKNNKIELEGDKLPNCIIYPVQTKKKYSLDLPYSEMFRQFVEVINRPNTALFIMGYSFLDEHVNDIITNALANPNFNLVVFSYQDETDENIAPYLKKLFDVSKEDSRITVLSGKILGNFKYIVKYLIPYPQNDSIEKVIYQTLKKIKDGAL